MKVWRKSSCICGSRYSSSKGWILLSNSQNFELFSERKSSIPWNVKLKNQVSFSLFFWRSPLHWIWLIWLKEEVEEKGNTFGTHRNAFCLLKTHLPIITNMFLIKNSYHFLDIGSRKLFDRMREFLFYNIRFIPS